MLFKISPVWLYIMFYDASLVVQSRSGVRQKTSLRNFDHFIRCRASSWSGVVWRRHWRRSSFLCSVEERIARRSWWIVCTALWTRSLPLAVSQCMNQIFRMFPKILWSKFLVRNWAVFFIVALHYFLPPWFSSYTYSWRAPLWMRGMGFLKARCSSCHLTNSVKALNKNI